MNELKLNFKILITMSLMIHIFTIETTSQTIHSEEGSNASGL